MRASELNTNRGKVRLCTRDSWSFRHRLSVLFVEVMLEDAKSRKKLGKVESMEKGRFGHNDQAINHDYPKELRFIRVEVENIVVLVIKWIFWSFKNTISTQKVPTLNENRAHRSAGECLWATSQKYGLPLLKGISNFWMTKFQKNWSYNTANLLKKTMESTTSWYMRSVAIKGSSLKPFLMNFIIIWRAGGLAQVPLI